MSLTPITLIISYSGKRLRKLRTGPSHGEPRLYPRILDDLDALRVSPPDWIEVIDNCERVKCTWSSHIGRPRSVETQSEIVTSLQHASQMGSSLNNAMIRCFDIVQKPLEPQHVTTEPERVQDDRGKRDRSPSLAASEASLQPKRMKVAEPDIQSRLGGRPPPRKRNLSSTLSLAERISGPSAASASMPARVQATTLLSRISGQDLTAAMSSRPSCSTHEPRMPDVSVEPSGSRPPLKSLLRMAVAASVGDAPGSTQVPSSSGSRNVSLSTQHPRAPQALALPLKDRPGSSVLPPYCGRPTLLSRISIEGNAQPSTSSMKHDDNTPTMTGRSQILDRPTAVQRLVDDFVNAISKSAQASSSVAPDASLACRSPTVPQGSRVLPGDVAGAALEPPKDDASVTTPAEAAVPIDDPQAGKPIAMLRTRRGRRVKAIMARESTCDAIDASTYDSGEARPSSLASNGGEEDLSAADTTVSSTRLANLRGTTSAPTASTTGSQSSASGSRQQETSPTVGAVSHEGSSSSVPTQSRKTSGRMQGSADSTAKMGQSPQPGAVSAKTKEQTSFRQPMPSRHEPSRVNTAPPRSFNVSASGHAAMPACLGALNRVADSDVVRSTVTGAAKLPCSPALPASSIPVPHRTDRWSAPSTVALSSTQEGPSSSAAPGRHETDVTQAIQDTIDRIVTQGRRETNVISDALGIVFTALDAFLEAGNIGDGDDALLHAAHR